MVVVAELIAIEGKEGEMEKALLAIIPDVKGEEGTLIYTLHRDMSDPTKFLFYEKYTDADALTVHSSTPHFKALFKTIKPLLAKEPKIGMYEELAGIN